MSWEITRCWSLSRWYCFTETIWKMLWKRIENLHFKKVLNLIICYYSGIEFSIPIDWRFLHWTSNMTKFFTYLIVILTSRGTATFVIIWYLALQLPWQSVVSLNSVHGEVYSIQHYVIVCSWLATGRWFSPISSNNKTDCHDIAEILLKVALNTITLTPLTCFVRMYSSERMNSPLQAKHNISTFIDHLLRCH